MSLKLESLYYFMILAESASFTQAAEKLCMTQQALSRHILDLEKSLGQSLIQRQKGSEQQALTPAGEILKAEAFPVLTRVTGLSEDLKSRLQETQKWHLRIGAPLALDTRIVDILNQASQNDTCFHPEITIAVGGSSVIETQVLKGQLDLGVLLQRPGNPDLAWAALKPVPFIIAGAKDIHGSWDELNYIAYLGNHHSLDEMFNLWPEAQWPRKIIARADVAMAMGMAEQGHFCLHIPEHFVDPAILKSVCLPPFEANYQPYLIWSQHKPLPEPRAQIQKLILEQLAL